jgi:hypothetical protein
MRRASLLLLVVVLSCTKPQPTLEGIDLSKWRNDKFGCAGDRQTMIPTLSSQSDKLKGLSEMDVIELLGKPDENELYKRNQKFYNYYVSPGPDCPEYKDMPDKLIIRFNAMGYAQLITLGPGQ